MRLKYLLELTTTADILYVGTEAMVWTLVEPGVSIIAASLVTIRPLLRIFNLSGFESSIAPGGASHTRSRYSRHFTHHTSPTLRNDIPSGGERWAISSVSTKGGESISTRGSELGKGRPASRSRCRLGGFKGNRVVVQEEEESIGMERVDDAVAWREETMYEGELARVRSVIGITKTVDVHSKPDAGPRSFDPC